MQKRFKICYLLLLLSFTIHQSAKADLETEKLLKQSVASLKTAKSFSVSYRAFQEHMAGVPELGMNGSFILQSGNRLYFTNMGALFIFAAQMECVSDGTNYLAIISPRTIQWEPRSVRSDFNESWVRSFVLGGAAPIVASQIGTTLTQADKNSTAKLLPSLGNQLSTSKEQLLGDEIIEGKAVTHVKFTVNFGTNEPSETDLWLDKVTLCPLKRITHDRRSGDVFESYQFKLNPSLPSDTFDVHRIIQSRKLESVIQKMETPDALLLKACRNGDTKLAADSMANGANPNIRTSFMDRPASFSPLMFAAQAGNLELIKLLIEHGAEVNADTAGSASPLQLACMNGKIETASYLINHGAILTNATASLCFAAWSGYSNIVVLLVEKGVPVDETAGELGTPLQRALQGNFLNIASYLIQHGADINKPERGSPVLHSAVRFGTSETVKFLLEAGAKPNERNSYGMTPLMYAASGNNADASKLLLEHGADPQLKDSGGQTAMDMIKRSLPNKEIVTFFEQRGLIKATQLNGKKP